MDVEAQDDGVMGKIVVPAGTSEVDVGRIIAMIAEEGEDINSIEVPQSNAVESKPKETPKETQEPKAAPATPKHDSHFVPKHSKHLMPAVARLLTEHEIKDAEKIPGTGRHGMLTKADVLVFLGQASPDVLKPKHAEVCCYINMKPEKAAAPPKAKEVPLIDGAELRRLITKGLAPSRLQPKAPAVVDSFANVIESYTLPTTSNTAPPAAKSPIDSFLSSY